MSGVGVDGDEVRSAEAGLRRDGSMWPSGRDAAWRAIQYAQTSLRGLLRVTTRAPRRRLATVAAPAVADTPPAPPDELVEDHAALDDFEFEEPADADETTARPETQASGLSLYLQRLRRLPALSLEDEQRLATAAQQGHAEALNKLVSHSLHIVPGIAREFDGRGLPLDDLIEEGNLGLYRAVAKFDVQLGYRFSTYARWWVRHEIRTAVLNKGRLIRLPVHVFKAMSRLRRNVAASGGSVSGTRPVWGDAPQADEPSRPSLGEAHALLRLAELPLSLDHPLDGGEDNTLVDTCAADASADPANRMEGAQSARALSNALSMLTPVERVVIERRFGLHSDAADTLEVVGRDLQLSAERVRQIQKQALGKLRLALEAGGHSGAFGF